MNIRLTISVPRNFNFWRTVYSHGWCALLPFRVVKEGPYVQLVINLSSHKAAAVDVMQPSRGKLMVDIHGGNSLSSSQKSAILSQVKTCLRLNEEFSEFYAEARKHRSFRWVPRLRAGRLLRAPTVFEDVVKMICTTNCSWVLTETMVENLCRTLGREVDEGCFSFPVPEALAAVTERFLRKEIHAGYRAPYLLELSQRIAKGGFDIESWRHSDLTTDALYKEVRSVKGVGPYAAGNILKLLGRYDYLALDSWGRKKFFEVHKNGRRTSDKVIEKFYEPFGKWKGLFFWMDVTKDWYEHEFPF